MEKISVAIRVRPPSKAVSPAPHVKGHKWSVGPHNVALYSTLGTPVNGQTYSFDHVFGVDAKNGDIHKGLTKDVIMSALNGFNGTVFAYGQTSSGKTYTMKGAPTDPGVIRLAVHDVFGHIKQMTNEREFLIRVSYMEIYNEDINDLLVPDNRRLRVHENLEKGIFVAGLREEIVDSPEKVFDLLEFGESHRHFGETNMNLYSSRSHTIFRMVIESRDKSQDGCEAEVSSDTVRVSCLNMVDLAGSERISKTGAGGVRLKEGTHINKSLMTLGTVINKLSDGTGKQGGHVPYRDSKLTRILQPALGGNAKTAMICTVTPDEIHIDETRGTLQFASRAKRVSTCAHVNEIVTDAALLKRQTKEIEELRMKLQGLPQSAHLEKEILNLRNELLKFELEKERLFLELREEKKAQVARERRIKEQEQKIENLSTLFMSSTLDDRDGDTFPKKQVNRRETWCPRPLSSQRAGQDFGRSNTDHNEDDETIDNILFTMKRDRNFTLPPAFEIDEEDDSCWPRTEIEEPEPLSDFENIADEDTWMSLNKGHTTSSGVFTPGISEKSPSTGNSARRKVVSLESQLRDLQSRYNELQMSCDVKIQEANQDLKIEVGKIKLELNQVQNENLILKNSLSAQLGVQRQLQYFLADLEFEMDAARLQTASMQGILAESLHVQAKILITIQECMTMACSQGGHLGSGQKARERKVLVDESIQKCRQICADAEHVLQDRPLHTDENFRRSSIHVIEQEKSERDVEHASIDMVKGGISVGMKEMEGSPSIQGVVGSSAPDFAVKKSLSKDAQYCDSCMSSALCTSKTWDDERAAVSNNFAGLTVEADDDEIAGGVPIGSLKVCSSDHEIVGKFTQGEGVSPSDQECDSLSRLRWIGVKVHALRALASRVDGTQGDLHSRIKELGNDQIDPAGIWDGFSSSDHAGCSFGTVGKNCDWRASHESVAIGKSQIPTAMSKLCGLILQLFDPSFFMLDAVNQNGKGGGAQQGEKLKLSLANAKLLATWLLEEVDGILGHDMACLSCHVKETGSLGVLLEALQVLLLQLASLSVGLLKATCQDEDLRKDLVQQLSTLRDAHSGLLLATTPKAVPPAVDASPEILAPEEERGSEKNPRQNYRTIDTTEVETFTDSADGYSNMMFSDRVVKVEGVEQVLGKVLQSSMTLLRKKHSVVKGDPLLLVLTVELEECCQEAAKLQRIQVGATSRSICRIFHDEYSARTGRSSDACFPSGELGDSILCGTSDMNSERTGSEDRIITSGCREEEGELRIQAGGSLGQRTVEEECEVVTLCFCQDASDGHWAAVADDIHNNSAARLVFEAQKVRKLEMRLAEAELEVVELKIEVEELRAKLQTHGEICQNDAVEQLQLDLQAHKNKCTKYEEEIRLLFGQSPEISKRERLLSEVMAENQFLQGCLAKAKKHVLRSKAWRDEIRKWKDMEITRRDAGPEEARVLCAQHSEVNLNEYVSQDSKVAPGESQVVHDEPPPPGTEGDVRPTRTALRPLNSNAPNEMGILEKQDHSKRRRQLQFSADNKYPSGYSPKA